MCDNNINPLAQALESATNRAENIAAALEVLKLNHRRALELARKIIIDNGVDFGDCAVLELVELGMAPFVYSMSGMTDITLRISWEVADIECATGDDLVALAVEDYLVDLLERDASRAIYGTVWVDGNALEIHGNTYNADTSTTHERD